MLQHELVCASSLTAYRHCAGPCTDQPCRTHTRHKTQPKIFALIISTEFGHASQQVLSPGLKDEGSIRIYRLPESSLNGGIKCRISWGREGRALAGAGGQRGADFVLPGWEARAPVESLPHSYLLHSSRCLQAPGHESPASSTFFSPSTQQPSQRKDTTVPCASLCQVPRCGEAALCT